MNLRTNVEADFSAFVAQNFQLLSPNGSLFCLKEQLMMLYIRDFLCTGHRCSPLPIEGQRKTSFTPFFLFGTGNILKNCEAGFSCFYVGEWEAFVGWWRGEVDTLQRTFPV